MIEWAMFVYFLRQGPQMAVEGSHRYPTETACLTDTKERNLLTDRPEFEGWYLTVECRPV
jgi:hypothetical protein